MGGQSSWYFPIAVKCKKIFKLEANIPHVLHRWQAELFQYKFVIWHRPEKNMWECDMLSRCNKATESWRDNNVDNAST